MKHVKLSDVCVIKYGKDHKTLGDGPYPVYGSGGIMRHIDRPLYSGPSVLIPRKGTLGNLFYSESPFWTVDTLFWTIIDDTAIRPKFLYYQLLTKDLASLNIGTAVPSLSTEVLNEIELCIPPLPTQERIEFLLGSLDSKTELNNRINDYLAA
ncbi:restriction endonuclease subunit S [Adlercreutzia aquisgranensis]|uniref:restriction endonuclease subunit S n=1 Tax=Adlercreutzia aquisgranensis TaxID=2941323 RepID=UPI003D80E20E